MAALLEEKPLTEAVPVLDELERARADLYRLLGFTLVRSPTTRLIEHLSRLDGGTDALGEALRDTAEAARSTRLEAAVREYDALFLGMTRGELLPYASYYLTGFLHERPLARLREDLARLGLARAEGHSDPEDHIGTMCEVMAGLIDGGGDILRPLADQRAFFSRHLEPWAGRFFADLEAAPSARLYRPLGTLGRLLVEIDHHGFLLEGS